MRTKYPYAADRKEYVNELIFEYKRKYPFLNEKQIKEPIKLLISTMDYKIREFNDYNGALININIMRALESDNINESALSQSILELRYLLKGDEESIRYYIEEIREVPLPKDIARYAEFVSKATKQVINDICSATEAKIPHSAKIEYQRWINEGRESPDTVAAGEHSTFVEKLEKEGKDAYGKKSLASMVRDGTEVESSSIAKKARVTFADEDIKKKSSVYLEDHEGENQTDGSGLSDEDTTPASNPSIGKGESSNQRSITAIAEIEETDNEPRESNYKTDLSMHDNVALLNPQLTQLYAWLSELPEWLQKQILNSSATQAWIEAAEQISNIYDIKSMPQAFAEFSMQAKEPDEEWQYNQEVAHKAEQNHELFDLSYTLDTDLMPVAAIMHDSAPAFGEIMLDQLVHWF